jgi:site-specific DNA recombinase
VAIFETYARTTSIVATLAELERRGIRLKAWTTQRDKHRGGAAFRDNSLRVLLANPLHVGQIRAGDEIVDAEHEAIVPRALWDEVQALLAGGRRRHAPRHPWSALLTGIIECAVCGSAMVPSYCAKGGRRYGYYTCRKLKDHGASACPGSRVAQGTVEAAVLERLREIGRDPAILEATVSAARAEADRQRAERQADAQRAGTEATRLAAEIDDVVARGGDGPEVRRRLNILRDAHDAATGRATNAKEALTALRTQTIEPDDVRGAIESFGPAWDELFPKERSRLVRLVVGRVSADGRTGAVEITLQP